MARQLRIECAIATRTASGHVEIEVSRFLLMIWLERSERKHGGNAQPAPKLCSSPTGKIVTTSFFSFDTSTDCYKPQGVGRLEWAVGEAIVGGAWQEPPDIKRFAIRNAPRPADAQSKPGSGGGEPRGRGDLFQGLRIHRGGERNRFPGRPGGHRELKILSAWRGQPKTYSLK